MAAKSPAASHRVRGSGSGLWVESAMSLKSNADHAAQVFRHLIRYPFPAYHSFAMRTKKVRLVFSNS
jgi:hypothetical protein